MTRRLAALLALGSVAAAFAVVSPTVGEQPRDTASAQTAPTVTVMGPSLLSADELVRYYRERSQHTYNVISLNPFTGATAPVPLEELARYFIEEGNRYNVRGDVAFAQSIVETLWLSYPSYGQVRPWNHNFAGIGACDSCDDGYQFPSAREGVRAQMQLLRNYADSTSHTSNIPDPPLPSLWGSSAQIAERNFNFFSHKGRAPYWIKPDCSSGCMGKGNWATSTTYSTTVTNVYRQMLSFYGRTIAPETIAERYANLDAGTKAVLGAPLAPEEPIFGGRMRRYAGGRIYWTSSLGAHEVYGAILDRYLEMGGHVSPLGFPVTGEAPGPGKGRVSSFVNGGIYWSPATGAHDVFGAIGQLYRAMGGPASVLGYPLTNEASTPGGRGRFNTFQGGAIYWSPATGAHEVHGEIGRRYNVLGGPTSMLGFPTGDERGVPGGRASSFQGGQMVWSPATGAHEVHGAIALLYAFVGGPGGFLGVPVTDEYATPGGAGRASDFQGGSIYWSPSTGTHVVHGLIGALYRSLGGPASFLGMPTSGERVVGGGRVASFQGGEIFWSPATGARELHGSILFLYQLAGGPLSFLGFPVTSETVTPDGVGRYNHFQGGSVYWSPATGVHEVHGAIRDFWAASGWERGALGYPTSSETPTPDGVGRFNRFQHGTVSWTPSAGAFRSS